MHRRMYLSGLAAVAASLVFAPAALAGHVAPDLVAGNPSCEDLGLTTITKFDPPNSGTQAGITLTRTGGSAFDWTSTVAVDAVIVKGGPDANVYSYDFDTFADQGLLPPINPSNDSPYGLSHVEFCTNNQVNPPPPPPSLNFTIDKERVENSAQAGTTVNFTITVRNTGTLSFTNYTINDPNCVETRTGANAGDTTFDPGDVWTYSCAMVTTVTMTEACNTVTVSGSNGQITVGPKSDTACIPLTPPPPQQALTFTLDKTGVEASATAGATVNFTITVTNTGNLAFANYTIDDPNCAETRTGANAGDTTFDPGDVWTYSCAMATTASMTQACNTVTVSGSNGPITAGPMSDTACIPLTPPPGGGGAGGGGVLPEETLSGLAALRGPSGCVKQAFRARVTGREIASVTFRLDGKVVKRITGEREVYAAKIRPNALGFGRHRVTARVTFSAESGTAARTLRLTFRRCARGQVAPRFTG